MLHLNVDQGTNILAWAWFLLTVFTILVAMKGHDLWWTNPLMIKIGQREGKLLYVGHRNEEMEMEIATTSLAYLNKCHMSSKAKTGNSHTMLGYCCYIVCQRTTQHCKGDLQTRFIGSQSITQTNTCLCGYFEKLRWTNAAWAQMQRKYNNKKSVHWYTEKCLSHTVLESVSSGVWLVSRLDYNKEGTYFD